MDFPFSGGAHPDQSLETEFDERGYLQRLIASRLWHAPDMLWLDQWPLFHESFWTQVAYADFIAEPATFCGLADLALLCRLGKSQGNVIYVEQQGEPLRSRTLTEVFSSLLDLKDGFELMDHDINPEASDKQWFFICCKADWTRCSHQHCNHWLPAWSKDQLQTHWDVLRNGNKTEVYGAMEKLMTEIARLSQQEGAELDDVAEAMLENITDQLETHENKLAIFEELAANGFVVNDVPADGNCALWSSLCLQKMNDGPLPMHSLDDVDLLREQLKQEWIAVSGDLLWQQIFWSLKLHWELPAEVVAACREDPEHQPAKRQKQNGLESPPKHADPKKQKPANIDDCRPANFGKRPKKDAAILKRAGAPPEDQLLPVDEDGAQEDAQTDEEAA